MTVKTFIDDFALAANNGARALPEWVRPVRETALERFTTLGFPTPKNEDWHFTSVAPIVESEFRTLRVPTGDVQPDEVAPFLFGHPEWPALVFVNGHLSPTLSRTSGLPPGVRLFSLASAWHADDTFLRTYLGTLADARQHAFTALNTAFLYDGAVLHIPRDVEVATPVHLVFVSDADGAKGVVHPRSLIVAERNAKVTVIESYVALGDASYFTNAITEVHVADGASVTHLKIQRESDRAYHVGTSEVRQGRDSHYESFSFATGGALARTNIYTVLDGEGSGVILNGLYLVDGNQHIDHQTRIEHAKPNCFSREAYRGILDDSGRGVFNGKVYVRPEAQKTDGKQENDNLLLSPNAHVDTKPQLEIFADDVRCTHGATVGRIDEQALFYMKSRGIEPGRARDLLTYAFAADVLERIALEPVRSELETLTLRRFTDDGAA